MNKIIYAPTHLDDVHVGPSLLSTTYKILILNIFQKLVLT